VYILWRAPVRRLLQQALDGWRTGQHCLESRNSICCRQPLLPHLQSQQAHDSSLLSQQVDA
jgi:hypothetical protein